MQITLEREFCPYCLGEGRNHPVCIREMEKLQVLIDTRQDDINVLADFLELSEYCKRCYFWSPFGNAANRRASEARLSREEWTIEFKGDTYTFAATMVMSCRNAYFSKTIYKNGTKTNLTVLKTLHRRLLSEA